MNSTPSLLARLRRDECRAFLAGFVLLAFLFRALIPVGFMPDMQALQHHVIKITLCSMDGAKEILVDGGAKQDRNKSHPSHKKEICAFGAAPQTALLDFVPLSLPVLFAVSERLAAIQKLLFPAQSSGIHQPRAPPAL